jgi:hypothetical protein
LRAKLQCHLNGISNARPGFFSHHDPVDNDLNVMDFVTVNVHAAPDLADHPIDADAKESIPKDLFEQFTIVSLSATDNRRQDVHPGPFTHLHDAVDDLVCGLSLNLAVAAVAILHADPREEKPEVIVNLSDRPDRGSGVVADSLLLNRYGRAQSLDVIDVGPLHHIKELTGIGGKTLDVAALTFCIDCVECQARFART